MDTLIVARSNRYGLTRDAAILAEAIRAAGGEAEVVDLRDRGIIDYLMRRKRARRVVHLERAHPRWFGAATAETLLVPNQERFPRRQLGRLARVDGVLAKSRHAEAIFAGLGVEARYLGFASEDRADPAVAKDWRRFFHLAGGSTLKGTEDVLALWERHPEWPELVLVQKAENAPKAVPANVRLLSGYLEDGELRRLQNACGVHLCPSRAEGWGHHIVEGLSCGAVVVTTDAPPMNEHVDASCGVLLPPAHSAPRHLGTSYFVDVERLESAVEGLLAGKDEAKAGMGRRARARYERIVQDFRRRVKTLLVSP